MYYISWNDCQTFIWKLNRLTGKTFRLPTEAEWEYAARGGSKSRGCKYSGSNSIGDVAWYKDNSGSQTHPVGTKQPNELGIYDMSGNVWEWCQDWYGSYGSGSQTDPLGPYWGSGRVPRGGSWGFSARICRVSLRFSDVPGLRYYGVGLRLVMPGSGSTGGNSQAPKPQPSSDFANRTFTVNGVSFTMIAVKGGTFTMGATPEQGSDADGDEKPTHRVTLSDYYIGKFEVTQELWQAVMGSNPSCFKGSKLPVEQVSWNDCQQFIAKLNRLTGKTFRLPTEAEWEYAARGGSKSRGYKYSGSNSINDVAWYTVNCYDKGSSSPDFGTHPVGTKSPNELGIYDMSGNVCEWCQDWYGDYGSGSQTDPQDPSSGSVRVLRGGSWDARAGGFRVSSRYFIIPDDYDWFSLDDWFNFDDWFSFDGLRLAL